MGGDIKGRILDFVAQSKKVGGAKIGGKPLACHHVTVLSVSKASDWSGVSDSGL